MKWFKHDSSANADAKLEKLLIRYGLEGYGLYWYCLELIAGQVEKHNLTFELQHDAELIAHRTRKHHEFVQEAMTYMVDLGLFENDRGIVTCLKMAKRTDEYTQKLLQHQSKTPDNVPRLSRQTPDSVGIKSELKEEKRREEKRSNKLIKAFRPPSVQEITDYCAERGNQVNPDQFADHYTANGWKVGKNPMRDWKAAVRTWERNSTGGNGHAAHQQDTRSRTKRVSDKLDEIARRDIQANGFTAKLG